MLVHHFLFLRRSAHFAINGYDVNLCNRTANKLQPIVDRGGVITLHGAVEGAGRLNMVDAKGACVRALVRVCKHCCVCASTGGQRDVRLI